ncbi:MAG: heparan-alpha-glucosaminide N-acetyltransferase [Candidatus Undinarchaeales archaeon]
MSSNKKRFWEIDFLRGFAVIMMIIFHFLFDLSYFGNYNVPINSGFWLYFARITAGIFIFLVGISLVLSSERAKRNKSFGFLKYLKRGLKIFSWGILITIITWIFLDKGTIVFGILHFIGISIIIAYPFIVKVRKEAVIWISVISIILAGIIFDLIEFGSYFTASVGLPPAEFYTLDFFPLIPWFALVLIGIYVGGLFYKNYERLIEIPDLSENKIIEKICLLGKNSLLIYLIHQPVLILVLYLIGIVNLGI